MGIPGKPKFDVGELEVLNLTTSSYSVPSRSEYPVATSYCGGRLNITYEDRDLLVEENEGCKSWTMTREWIAWEKTENCEGDDRPRSDPLVQVVSITDDTVPELTDDNEKDVRIPFFSNYQSSNSVPSIRDGAADPSYGKFSTKLVNEVSLSSFDYDLIIARGEDSNNATCHTDGLASFVRRWTIQDSCSNRVEKIQSVTIEHPPTDQKPVQEPGSFSRSIGVEQLSAPCAPGKMLYLGRKEYLYMGSPTCTPNLWEEDGCQAKASFNKT